MSEQHKPQEWDYIDFYDLDLDQSAEKAKEINAALADSEQVSLGRLNEIIDLEKQLAAERDKVQTLVDALKEIAHDETIGSYKACDLARNALAKVGK